MLNCTELPLRERSTKRVPFNNRRSVAPPTVPFRASVVSVLTLPDTLATVCAFRVSARFVINSVKSCNSFSVGQLAMLRQLEERTGVPGGFIESDLVDPRYFSAANIRNRLESYLQMLEQKRSAARA